MGIRIQPLEIVVPPNDPFKNDLLGRKKPVEVLTHLVSSLEGPCVLAVDAAWGNGKTTFLNMWAQYLRNQEFLVVKFNAWETDFSGDPFIALSTELTDGLKEFTDKSLHKNVADTKKYALEIAQLAVPGAIRLLTSGVLDITPLLKEERGDAYQKAKNTVKKFKDALQEAVKTASKPGDGRPLIVMIDELDRCRPSYAVELLEVAKHLFAVDDIVFVLAVNHSELAYSIKALYGDGFDAQGYLRRFFDVDFRLPEPDRVAFINQMLASIKLNDYFERTQDQSAREDYKVVTRWLQHFFYTPDLSLRRVAQAIHRLGLVFSSLRSDHWSFAKMATMALILRTIDSDLYHKFVRGDVTDLDVVNKVFSRPGTITLKHQDEGHQFEATLIAATQERKGMTEESRSSQLLQQYYELIGPDEASKLKNLSDWDCSTMLTKHPDCSGRNHARTIIILTRWSNRDSLQHGSIGFGEAVQRIELLSPALIDDSAT